MNIQARNVETLGRADTQYFNENGFLLVRGLYADEEVSSAKECVLSALPESGCEASGWAYSNAIVSIASQFSQTEAEWALYQNTTLVEAVVRLTGWESMRWSEVTGTLVVAWPNQADGNWPHLDYSGGPIDGGEGLVFGMIYLTDVDASGARTKVIPESHRIVRRHLVQKPDDPRNQHLSDDITFLDLGKSVPVSVQAGDVLLFDHLLAHSGGGQQCSEPRPVLRVGFHNGQGAMSENRATVPNPIEESLTPLGRKLAGI